MSKIKRIRTLCEDCRWNKIIVIILGTKGVPVCNRNPKITYVPDGEKVKVISKYYTCSYKNTLNDCKEFE